MAWGALAAGAGAVIQGLASYKSAQKQMKFQREMSGTAIQRQMADMRKAGINPILAAKYGGASTPSGASYSVPNIGAAAVEGYKGVSSAKQMQQQARLTGVQADIQKRTLDMLEKNNITMAEIQFTAKNVFESKALRAFEGALKGDLSDLREPYRGLASSFMVELKKAGMLPSTAGMQGEGPTPLDISGKKAGKLISQFADMATDLGLKAITEQGFSLFERIKGIVK